VISVKVMDRQFFVDSEKSEDPFFPINSA